MNIVNKILFEDKKSKKIIIFSIFFKYFLRPCVPIVFKTQNSKL